MSTKYVISATYHGKTSELIRKKSGFPNHLSRKKSLKIRKDQSICSHTVT